MKLDPCDGSDRVMSHRALLFLAPSGSPPPLSVCELAERNDLRVSCPRSASELLASVSRAYPGLVVIDSSTSSREALAVCRTLKGEPFTAVVPVVVLVDERGQGTAAEALEAGADEVVSPRTPARERALRLQMALRRADRDVSVHPTTRLPGTVQIERDMGERLRSGSPFAVCYADLDHFKEFNDRYGYNHGDRVILIVSRILRDIVRAHSPSAFVGHIGGDDFIFNVSLEDLDACCADVIETFDLLMPLQYTADDRNAGFYLGQDRRGQTYRVPLMTLSIGVVTNERWKFSHPAEISRVATEMKKHAKRQTGSVFLVDRRTGPSSTRADP